MDSVVFTLYSRTYETRRWPCRLSAGSRDKPKQAAPLNANTCQGPSGRVRWLLGACLLPVSLNVKFIRSRRRRLNVVILVNSYFWACVFEDCEKRFNLSAFVLLSVLGQLTMLLYILNVFLYLKNPQES